MKESSLKSVNELISKFEEWCASSVLGLISSSVGLEPVNSGASFPTISREISVTETCAAYSLARYKWRRHRDQGPVHKVVYRYHLLPLFFLSHFLFLLSSLRTFFYVGTNPWSENYQRER